MQKQHLAMAEIPVQEMDELYEPEQALAAGTVLSCSEPAIFCYPGRDDGESSFREKLSGKN